jgi:redox-sensitive bicupin YhaK (pirin superfamily)
VLFANDGQSVTLTASEDAHVILLAGEPINEPIVQYGPFVMNDVAEIRQALLDVQRGKFGAIPPDADD